MIQPLQKPYFDQSGKPILRKSVVVYADIVGFKKRTSEAFVNGQAQIFLEELHQSLEKSLANIRHSGPYQQTSLKVFSDNLVLGFPFFGEGQGAFEIPAVCLEIGQFQRDMAVRGFFVRGGIAIGDVHISENLIFMNKDLWEELYSSEEVANVPRIVLLSSVSDHFNIHPDVRDNEILDMALYEESAVNYLLPLRSTYDSMRSTMLKTHKQHIQNNLNRYPPDSEDGEIKKIHQKFVWVARYHNDFCQKTIFYNSEEYLIKLN